MSEASEEMKSPIIEKSKMGQEDDNELLVKGESPVVCVILYLHCSLEFGLSLSFHGCSVILMTIDIVDSH